MSSPFAAPALLAAGLVFLFAGERAFGDEPVLRAVLDLLGFTGVVASFVSRGRGRANLPDETRRWIAWAHVGIVLGLALYVVQLPAVLARLGLGAADAEKAARAALGTLWPILLLVAASLAFFLDAALAGSRRVPEPEALRLRGSAQAGAVLGLLVAIFALANYLAAAHPVEVDLSRKKVGRPSDATMAIVRNLDAPIFVNAFFQPANEVGEEIEPYLRALESGSGGKLFVHRWDHALDPRMAKRVNARDNGALYLTAQSLQEGLGDGEPPAVSNEKLQLGVKLDSAKSTLKKFDAEMQKRLLKLARGSRKIYFTSGHGERNARGGSHVDKEDGRAKLSVLNRWLGTQSYEVKLLSAADGLASEVPADAAAVVIAGATQPFLDGEIEALKTYFEGGGSIMVFLESGRPEGVPVKLLEALGVTYDGTLAANDRTYIVETRQASDRYLLATNKTTSHASVTTLSRNRDQLFMVIPRAGTLAKVEGTSRNVQLVVGSMPGGFRDVNGNFQRDEDESVPPEKLSFVAAVEGEKKDGKAGKAVVAASAEIADDKWIAVDGNRSFVSDAVKWLAGDENISAPVAAAEEDIPIKHTRKQDTIWFYGTIFLAPAMVLAGGLTFVSRARRGRRS